MRLWFLILSTAGILAAADEQQLALELRAQADFERVQMAATPSVADTTRCIQSQAALLPVVPASELALHLYRKAYCTLVGGNFATAASEFDKAIESWHAELAAKKEPDQPAPSALAVL